MKRRFPLLEDVIHNNPGLGRYEVARGLYNDGARIRQTYWFIDQKSAITADDIVNPELHLFNSYDVTWLIPKYYMGLPVA